MSKMYIVADDLTGSVDTSAFFADHFVSSNVLLDYSDLSIAESEVCAINTASREGDSSTAKSIHYEIGLKLRSFSDLIIIKKTDMGFRGNHGYDIEGLFTGLDCDVCFLVNAFPAYNTYVLDSCQYVRGLILTESIYAKDPTHKPLSSSVPDIISAQTSFKIGSVKLEDVRSENLKSSVSSLVASGAKIIVFDCITDDDCLKIVSDCMQLPYRALYAGTLGLVNAFSSILSPEQKRKGYIPCKTTPTSLGFTSSNYITVVRQLEYARQHGLRTATLNISECTGSESNRMEEIVRVEREAESLLSQGSVIVNQSQIEASTIPGIEHIILDGIKKVAVDMINNCNFERLVMIGGETAFAILSHFGVRLLSIKALPMPGVAAGTIENGTLKGVPFSLKGGSAGDDEAIWRMMTAEIQ